MLREEDEPFTLEVPPVRRGKSVDQFHDQPGLQKNLIDGLECLPGQLDLFTGDACDGE